MRPLTVIVAIAAVLAAAACWLLSGQAALVDWSRAHAVVFESDDWGLCGFVPRADALQGLATDSLRAGRVPPVYWGSTLEDSAAVAALAGILAGHRGADGLPPVWQPNYILAALAFDPDGPADAAPWRRHDLPDLPAAYARPGLWRAVAAARAEGVWRPELHGALHYDPERRREAVAASPPAAAAAARGVLPFPGVGRAWELGPWRPTKALATELDRSLRGFARLFGRPPTSIMAPDYVWDGRCEDLWQDRGLDVIQGKREQRNPAWLGRGAIGRLLKVADRGWSRRRHPGRIYLERNCRLEPVQAADPGSTAAACLGEVRRAWRAGEPAVVESHRVNYVHTDPAVPAAGRRALQGLLAGLEAPGPAAPLYLTDAEVASLARRGTSAVFRGERLVLRNLTRSLRLVPVPGGAPDAARLVPLPAGATVVLPPPSAPRTAVPIATG